MSQKPLASQSLRSMTVLQSSHRETADEVLFREFLFITIIIIIIFLIHIYPDVR